LKIDLQNQYECLQMKLGTIGAIVGVFAAMISAALAFRYLVLEPSTETTQGAITESLNADRFGNRNSPHTGPHDGRQDASPSGSKLAGENRGSNQQSVSGSDAQNESLQSDPKKKMAGIDIGTGHRLSEDISNFSGIKSGEEITKVPMRRPNFDVIRVAPDGVSVFAGHAEPGAKVIVIVNGKIVGEAIADPEGAWTVVTVLTEHHKEMELTLRAQMGSNRVAEITQPVHVEKIVSAEIDRPQAESLLSRSRTASAGGEDQLGKSQPKVARRRLLDDKTVIKTVEESANRKMALGPKIAAPKKTVEGKPIIVETEQEGVVIASPVPINFVYKEAVFTDEGKKAVAALLEFILRKKLNKIVLSGHTDERGTEEFNMTLSEARLVAVSTFLRSNGFTGNIELRPMGEIRPIQIRNPEEYSQEEIWQFNRRVELEGSE